MNCIDFFDHGFYLNPDGACLIRAESGQVWTYRTARALSIHIANALLQRGYGVGSKAAVLSPNDPEAFIAALSIMRGGLSWIPVNPRNSVAENGHILDAFDCELVFFHSSLSDIVPQIATLAPRIREFVCIDGEAAVRAVSLDAWIADYPADEFNTPHDPDRIYAIFPTGGTTGLPKGVMMPNRAVENIVSNFLAVAPCDVTPVFLAAAPLTHAAGSVMQYIMALGGCGVVLPKPDRLQILQVIEQYGATHTFLPPTLIYDLLSLPEVKRFDYSSLRYLMYGAAPMAPEKLKEAIDVFGPVLTQIYGQIEIAVPALFMAPMDHFVDGEVAPPARLAACGRKTPFVNIQIMDDQGRLLPAGEVGEIVVRSQGVMLGYYKSPVLTAEVSQYGWHHTGDVGYRDDDGFFYIVDRKKDMIISGGFNVYSAEVERVVLAHPSVKDCAVIGVPDAKWGEAVKAVIELKEGAKANAEEIIAHCKAQIGSMKSPKSVDFLEVLPRSGVGKVLKREIRKTYWAGRERQV